MVATEEYALDDAGYDEGYPVASVLIHLMEIAPGQKAAAKSYLQNLPDPCVGSYFVDSPPITFTSIPAGVPNAGQLTREFDVDDPDGFYPGTRTLIQAGDYFIQVTFSAPGNFLGPETDAVYHRELNRIYAHFRKHIPGF